MKLKSHAMTDQFWLNIANDIGRKFGREYPRYWEKDIIVSFLDEFEEVLIKILRKDNVKAGLCGVPYVKGEYHVESWKPH